MTANFTEENLVLILKILSTGESYQNLMYHYRLSDKP